MFIELLNKCTVTMQYEQYFLCSIYPHAVNIMESQLERLTKYMRLNYKSQQEFATAVGLTRSGLSYTFKSAKANGGKFSQEFLLRLEHRNLNVFSKDSLSDQQQRMDYASVNNSERVWLIELVETQKALIESLQAQLKQYAPDVGKAGARRTSV